MLTLNSQRKAFLAMVAWSEGTDKISFVGRLIMPDDL